MYACHHKLTCLILMTGFMVTAAVGCERKEKVLDIKAPGVNVEVNKTTGPGSQGIEIKTDKR